MSAASGQAGFIDGLVERLCGSLAAGAGVNHVDGFNKKDTQAAHEEDRGAAAGYIQGGRRAGAPPAPFQERPRTSCMS
jgi:hypothetical protein